jgi:hypothetical protein
MIFHPPAPYQHRLLELGNQIVDPPPHGQGMLGRAKPEIAELSFKYALSEGAEAGAAARRALALFKALQSDLKEWASPDRETKTSAALPAACHR